MVRQFMRKVISLLLAFVALAACSTNATTAGSADAPTEALLARPTAFINQPTHVLKQLTAVPAATARAALTATPLPSPAPTAPATATPAPARPIAYSYPLGIPGRPLGDGFFIRDAYAVENTWYNPGWLHTAEDWYLIEGSSVGARVYTVADGEVVYAGANYPGRVVIVRHDDSLFSMYGHLDPALAVETGQRVARGDLIGTIGPDAPRAPGHLHFEIRTFLTERDVNGAAPRYGYRCGVNCPPGPGYWPIDAPDHPSDRGWRNPTHVIAGRMFAPGTSGAPSEVVAATRPVSPELMLWSNVPGVGAAPQAVETLALQPGQRFPLLEIQAGAEDTREVSARNYRLWYRIALPDGRSGWAQAAVPSASETDSQGRPVSVRFNFLLARISPGLT
jgi:murein DD-endopeptidase MepM/ murein hydrolase activator NlpD